MGNSDEADGEVDTHSLSMADVSAGLFFEDLTGVRAGIPPIAGFRAVQEFARNFADDCRQIK